ncbi:MAG TPA: hypothetical protein RMH99_31930 [Sandaracinaceae bacterium LLY-WYZ-13_1]|nr:hypothetical protein [Sandaracinaceae bacterium LLY-WYZ-13_1]
MEERSPESRKWKWIALVVLVLPAAAGLWALASSTFGGSETLGPVRGLSLGFGPAQARERLRTAVPGSFRSTAIGEDFAIDWTPDGAATQMRAARMEFHLGQLVALRLTLSSDAPEAEGPDLELSEASVLTRERAPDGSVELTWLARSCPTHADEVRQRITQHR